MKRKIVNIICCLIIFITSFFVFINSSNVSNIFNETLSFLAKVILPSLFPFMIFVNFILISNCIDYLAILLKSIGKIFNISGYGVAVVIASILGGFPYSAILVENFVKSKKITIFEGERLSYFLFFPSFTFFYSSLYKYDQFTLLAIFSLYFTSFIFLYLSKFFKRYKNCKPGNRIELKINNNYDDLFYNVLKNSFSAINNIALCIIFFNIISSLFNSFFKCCFINNLFSGILEFSKTSIQIINKIDKSYYDYLLLTFILSFSSFSIILQSYYYLKNIHIKLKKLLFYRLAISSISSIIFTILYIIC